MANLSDLYPSRFLRAADLKGKDVTAVIEASRSRSSRTTATSRKPVLIFKGTSKGLVLNKTNALMVAGVCGSRRHRRVAGDQVSLYGTMVAYQGRVTEAIRVQGARHAPCSRTRAWMT